MKIFQYIFSDSVNRATELDNELEKLSILALLGVSLSRLTEKDQLLIEQYIKEGKLDNVLSLVQSKYTAKEWPKVVEKEVGLLIDDYLKK